MLSNFNYNNYNCSWSMSVADTRDLYSQPTAAISCRIACSHCWWSG